ncbi:MAG: heme exporter protein CcmB, partial [Gammaproteobacteria bacterium]|nr:heme exporter protein CcmB [Gammaproteobacteria bacterium]
MSTRRALSGLLRRDLLLAFRRRGDALTPLMFFAMVTLMFPLGLAPEQSVLRMVAPGLLWVAALLASLIGLSSLFGPDYEDGYLEQLVLSREPLSLMVLTRVFAHWLIT